MRSPLAIIPIAFILGSVDSATGAYPEGASIQLLGYNALEILEREEAFANMLTALVNKMIPIAYAAAEAAAKQLALRSMKDLQNKVEKDKVKLEENKSFVRTSLINAFGKMSTLLDAGNLKGAGIV